MNKTINNNYGSSIRSIGSALILHFLLLLIFYQTNIDNNHNPETGTIFLQFKNIDKAQKGGNDRGNTSDKKKPVIKKTAPKIIEMQATKILADSNQSLTNLDSNKIINTMPDSSAILDSFIVHNPDIAALKTAMQQKLKNLKTTEPDSARIVKNFKEQLLAYYKFLYPTPLSKFKGSPSGNGMISIPLDDIINLFK